MPPFVKHISQPSFAYVFSIKVSNWHCIRKVYLTYALLFLLFGSCRVQHPVSSQVLTVSSGHLRPAGWVCESLFRGFVPRESKLPCTAGQRGQWACSSGGLDEAAEVTNAVFSCHTHHVYYGGYTAFELLCLFGFSHTGMASVASRVGRASMWC